MKTLTLMLISSLASLASTVTMVGSSSMDKVVVTTTNVLFHDLSPNPQGGAYFDYGSAMYGSTGGSIDSSKAVKVEWLSSTPGDMMFVSDGVISFIPIAENSTTWFGTVNAGDKVLFELKQADGQIFYSDPSLNHDGGVLHASHTPEPFSMGLIGLGLIGIGFKKWQS